MTSYDMMPVWDNDTELDLQWIQNAVKDSSIIQATIEDMSNDGRKGVKAPKDGATLKVTITRRSNGEGINSSDDPSSSSTTTTMIMKQTPPAQGLGLSQSLGLAREALFYKELAPQLTKSGIQIPNIYYSFGNYETGEKCILMEDLGGDDEGEGRYLDSGILFGPGNPNNWNRNLPEQIEKAYGSSSSKEVPSAEDVTTATFVEIAKVHATFWNDESLLTHSWLRGSSWVSGNSKESWEASQGLIQGIYKNGIDTKITWDPLVKDVVDHVMSNISWDKQLERLNTNTNWTLVHGDFWPGNILVSTEKTSSPLHQGIQEELKLKMLDWEMVGIGSGPQDLGQYILSNMSVVERRECETRVVQAYYDELVKQQGVKNVTFEECFQEYKVGGIERWLWFLVWFCGQPDESPMLKWAQFFHDQIGAFLKDHNMKPTDLTQPRP